MAIKVRAKEQLIKVGKYADTYRYVMVPETPSSLSSRRIRAGWQRFYLVKHLPRSEWKIL